MRRRSFSPPAPGRAPLLGKRREPPPRYGTRLPYRIRDGGLSDQKACEPSRSRFLYHAYGRSSASRGNDRAWRSIRAPLIPNRIAVLERRMRKIFPNIGPIQTQWLGFRPSLPDSLPVIGPSRRHPNLIHAFGHGHLGMTFGDRRDSHCRKPHRRSTFQICRRSNRIDSHEIFRRAVPEARRVPSAALAPGCCKGIADASLAGVR
jgi:hypothetical protein